DFPSPDVSMLSDEHIARLESDSRTAVSERIRILSALQVQLSHMIVTLTQVESLIPSDAQVENALANGNSRSNIDKGKEAASD
ncbi:hypothetical protein LPJ73_006844, partial [Coemansia sp. RSA 2703]